MRSEGKTDDPAGRAIAEGGIAKVTMVSNRMLASIRESTTCLPLGANGGTRDRRARRRMGSCPAMAGVEL
jgi:hypothetical protein